MRRVRIHIAFVPLAVAALLIATIGPAAAVEPNGGEPTATPRPPPLLEELGVNRRAVPKDAPDRPSPAPSRTPRPTPTPTAEPTPVPAPEVGIDVSYPQCGKDLPNPGAFAIVGVNGGRVYRANPCLASGDGEAQLTWAGRGVELYANTANPGPRLSRYWPNGQVEPRECRPGGLLDPGTEHDCAYLYGWNAAADSYRIALEAFAAAGWADEGATELPWRTTWWLDVESANSWLSDAALNVAALEGARDYLVSRDVAEVGFYSTPRMWARITGGTDAFRDHPAWHAGASDVADALRRCDQEAAFTGGELRMVQWVEGGLDHNVRCP